MKPKILILLLLLSLLPFSLSAQTFVNLTPKPKSMTIGKGTYELPKGFGVACRGISKDMAVEVNRFIGDINTATGLNAKRKDKSKHASLHIGKLDNANAKLKPGGYTLKVGKAGITVKANDATGLYYAFQTIKKILPPNVMAVLPAKETASYALPFLEITDEPRFQYRGFMLDVSRHFFSVDEIKRMIDIMSYYKMNKFHWHLTDDQGWRVEIKKYPRLTTIGATAPNSRFTSLDSAKAYWTNKPYGPYFYTQDEMRDVVAYAKMRHIDIIPEIDMPGHFCAALAAYPELSCTPNGTHDVKYDGGVYTDVLNVANPKAMQFIYDIIDELSGIFPYKYIHIGGDECPTKAWQENADCKKLYDRLALTNWRQMQSWFISKVDSCAKAHDRTLAMWNECITEKGADLDLMRKTGAPIYCWVDADAAVVKAHRLGLPSIYTPWGPYYINRRQGNGPQDPPGAGDGTDHVKATYNLPIPPTVAGVQATFWTEWVSDREYLEWLALPRLIAMAEAGWTPQSERNFDDFIRRAAADTKLLDLRKYKYCTYFMPHVNNKANW